MNILPKKRWHVRTKDNIARVRRDEAAAREEEQKRQGKLELAESEARINYLRRRQGLPEKASTVDTTNATAERACSSNTTQRVDLFADYKAHIKTTNKDLEKEKKDEQEKYEKQIGYLTYLGQDTNEALKVRSWYEKAPKRSDVDDFGDEAETQLKHKLSQDPLTLINALLPPEKKVVTSVVKKKRDKSPETIPEISKSKKHKKEKKHHKKHKKHKSKSDKTHKESLKAAECSKREKLDRLRKERLRREAIEKQRQDALFAPKEEVTQRMKTPAPTPRIVQKYNSQFNPEYAKQNMV